MSGERTRTRRRGPRKVTLALAVVMAVLALVAGLLAGLSASGGDPAPITTIQSTVPITVTPGQ